MTEAEYAAAWRLDALETMRRLHAEDMVDHQAMSRGKDNFKTGTGRPRKHNLGVDDFQRCAALGMTKAETARKLNVSPHVCDYMAKQYDVKFPKKGRANEGR